MGSWGKANPKGAGPQTAWSPPSVAGSLSPPPAWPSVKGATIKKTFSTTDGAAVIFTAATTFTVGDRSRVKQRPDKTGQLAVALQAFKPEGGGGAHSPYNRGRHAQETPPRR
jgi:hypothetical protein